MRSFHFTAIIIGKIIILHQKKETFEKTNKDRASGMYINLFIFNTSIRLRRGLDARVQ